MDGLDAAPIDAMRRRLLRIRPPMASIAFRHQEFLDNPRSSHAQIGRAGRNDYRINNDLGIGFNGGQQRRRNARQTSGWQAALGVEIIAGDTANNNNNK